MISSERSVWRSIRFSAPALYIAVLLLAFNMQACSDDNNIVSPSFNAGEQNLSVDTLTVSNVAITELKTFTGNLRHFSAGKYDDAVFGQLHASAFIAPGVTRIENDDFIEAGAEMFLILKPREFFGVVDSMEATASYELRYVTERWRATAFDANKEVATNPQAFATFEVTAGTDSIAIPMPEQWVEDFRAIYMANDDERETLVRDQEFGFAIVPTEESNAITGFRSTFTERDSLDVLDFRGSRLFVKNPVTEESDNGNGDDEDQNGDDNGNGDNGDEDNGNGEDDGPRAEFFVPLRSTGFNLFIDNNEVSAPSGALPMLNTFQQVVRLDTELDDRDFTEQVVSRAELLFFDFEEDASTLPAGHRRPQSERLLFYTLDETEREFEVIKSPVFEPPFREGDSSYRINVTNFVEQVQLGEQSTTEFFIIPERNNGLIIPRLLAGPEAGERAPKLIITRINPETN